MQHKNIYNVECCKNNSIIVPFVRYSYNYQYVNSS